MPSVFEKTVIFEARTQGIFCYRIPALIRTKKGTLIDFCEARMHSCSDWAHSALMARRCLDPLNHFNQWEPAYVVKESDRMVKAETWDEMVRAEKVAEEQGVDPDSDDFVPMVDVVTNNPAVVVDADSERIHLIYNDHYDQAYYTYSDDDGISWSESIDITSLLLPLREKWDWTVLASGPGHVLQLLWGPYKGRIIVPFWLAANQASPRKHNPTQVATIYSDDHGDSWHLGEFLPFSINDPNESELIQLENGEILLMTRSNQPKDAINPVSARYCAISPTGIDQWGDYEIMPNIPEPICMGSIIRLHKSSENGKSCLLITLPNPSAIGESEFTRKNLSVFISETEGKDWHLKKVIESGFTAYSDLAVDPENNLIYCVYEAGYDNGVEGPYASQKIVKFNLEWLNE